MVKQMHDDIDLETNEILSEKPIEAVSYFWISKYIIQQIIFKYFDPEMNYRKIEEKKHTRRNIKYHKNEYATFYRPR